MTIPFHFDVVDEQPSYSDDAFQEGIAESNILINSTSHHLVLDLDHTLISSFEFGESSSQRRGIISTVCPILVNEYKDEFGLPELYHATISNVVVLIKLRPHVRRFIRDSSEQGLFLHVYTKGRRSYMNEIIRLLDPEGCYIKGSKVSRDAEPGYMRDNQKDPSLVDEVFGLKHKRPFVVLDDSPTVWSSCASYAEVIPAQRYSFCDHFVQYLRSGNRVLLDEYPRDSDVFLSSVLDSLIQVSFSRISTGAPVLCGTNRTVTAATTIDEEDTGSEDTDSTPIINTRRKVRICKSTLNVCINEAA